MKSRGLFPVLAALTVFIPGAALHPASAPRFIQNDESQRVLANDHLRADFIGDGLRTIQDKHSGHKLTFEDRGFTVIVDGRPFGPRQFPKYELSIGREALTYIYDAGTFKIRLVYELKPGWRFLSKQLFLEPAGPAPIRVREVRAFDAALDVSPREELRLSDGRFGLLLRFMDEKADSRRPSFGAFLLYQNPYNQWMRQDRLLQGHYLPDMDWRREFGPFPADRLCLGMIELSGRRVPAKSVPEWMLVADYDKYLAENPTIDMAESDALVECVRAFLLYRPEKSIRVHVPWCENDYQIDVATPEGWAEYQRIIDRAAELGCRSTLLHPGQHRSLQPDREPRRLGLGKSAVLRARPEDPQGGVGPGQGSRARRRSRTMIDYGQIQGPEVSRLCLSLPAVPAGSGVDPLGRRQGRRLQRRRTRACAASRTGGSGRSSISSKDRGRRAIPSTTGGSPMTTKASSKYAQWYGCRRILEELRGRVPGHRHRRPAAVHELRAVDLAGRLLSPPHADRRTARELHRLPRPAHRPRFGRPAALRRLEIPHGALRPARDHARLHDPPDRADATRQGHAPRPLPARATGTCWAGNIRCSPRSATAPFNHVVSFIPARDEDEFKALSEEDKPGSAAGWTGPTRTSRSCAASSRSSARP